MVRGPAWLAPVALLLLLAAIIVSVVLVARELGKADVPPQPDRFVAPTVSHPTVAFNVQSRNGATLRPGEGDDVVVPAGTPVEILEAAPPSVILAGQWLTVIGIPNGVKNFSIRMILVQDRQGTADADGLLRTIAGFAGDEANADKTEAVILGGRVTSAAPAEFDAIREAAPARVPGIRATIETAVGSVTIEVMNDGPTVRILRQGGPDDINESDRVAFHAAADGKPDVGKGALVLRRGAR